MISTPWEWQFPPIAEPEITVGHQTLHIREEVLEVAEAVGKKDDRHTAEELMDVIHAAETTLRMLPFDDNQLSAIKRGVIEKNDRRGYYGGES